MPGLFKYRSYKEELLDKKGIPKYLLKRNLQEIDNINLLLGGHSITLSGLKRLLGDDPAACEIVDIGCGNGGTLKHIARWAGKKNIKISLKGIDINPEAVEIAKENCRDFPEIEFETADFREYLKTAGKPDIIITTLFCHHFPEEDLISFFRWQKQNCRKGFLINDLQRNPLAYYSIWLISRLCLGTRLLRNDAPLSVLRGFSKHELKELLERSGISHAKISWEWAFRYLVTYRTENEQA